MTNYMISACDNYLASRTGHYDWRAVRYRSAIRAMGSNLTNDMTLIDVGAGMTEFDYCLRAEYGWRGRYIPVDSGVDGTDLNHWIPPREAHWFVALEILEHIYDWRRLVSEMKKKAHKGIVVSTPNPETTDVLGMDSTHVCEVWGNHLEELGFKVEPRTFYGGVFSDGKPDSLFAVWEK